MAMTTPLVTVLMPVYNAGGYIVEAARSMLDQGIDDLELLVVDDGSTDDSMAELATIADPRIRVVSQPNAGLVAALNHGLDQARGTYIARMDADDLCPPQRLRRQLSWFSDNPGGVVCGTDYEMFGTMTGRVRMPRSDRACRQRLLVAGALCGASAMMRRDVVIDNGLRFDPEYIHAEDFEFYARMSAFGEIGNVPIVGYRYRIHGDQVSLRHNELQRAIHLRVAAAHARRVGAAPLSDSVLRDLLWPHTRGVPATARVSGVAAVRAVRRSPSIESVRFCSRRVLEAVLAARRG